MSDELDKFRAALADRYVIERELGRGGMAVVYLARDLRHDRLVALKTLLPGVAQLFGRERFLRETQLAARLSHPHVLAIHDSGEAADRLFYVTPYVRGGSLRERLKQEQRLPVAETLQLTRQVAAALSYAHGQGVIHRDIKPENILLEDGEAVVADFGIARALAEAGDGGSRLTETGLLVGTPAYMSPEQLVPGSPVDNRADLYALATVCYEMLVGRSPYGETSTPAQLAARLTTAAPSVRLSRPEVPEPVAAALARAMAPDPAERPASAAEFALALADGSRAAPPPLARFTPSVLAVLALAVVLLSWGGWRIFRPQPVALNQHLLAVLPFRATGAGADSSLGESMVDLLTINLDGAAGLRAIPAGTVLSRWRREIGSAGVPTEQERVLAVARGAGGRWALSGNIVASSGILRLTAEVFQTNDGALLGRAQVEGPADSLGALVDRLSFQLLRSGFMGSIEGLEAPNLARVTTSSLTALKAYLSGEQRFRRSEPVEAMADFKRAVQADSGFALAYYRLAVVDGWTRSPHDPTASAWDSVALQLAAHLPIREQRLIRANAALNDGNPVALDQLDSITTASPQDAEAWYLLGEAEYHLGYIRYHPIDRFRVAMHRALALDPGFGPVYLHLVDDAFYELDSARVGALLAELERVEPASPKTLGLKLASALSWGDSAVRRRAAANLDTVPDLVLLTAKHALDVVPDLSQAAMIPARALFSDPRRSPDSRTLGLNGFRMALQMQGKTHRSMALLDSVAHLRGEYDPTTLTALQVQLGVLGLVATDELSKAVAELADSPWPDDHLALGFYSIAHADTAKLRTETNSLRAFAGGRKHKGDFSRACLETGAAVLEETQAFLQHRSPRRGLETVAEELHGCGILEYLSLLQLRYFALEQSIHGGAVGETERLFDGIPRQLQGPFIISYRLGVEYARGQAAELSGDRAGAKLHYGNLVRWLKAADAGIPLKDWAREGLTRVSGEPQP